ncbi:MAG: SCP2 sterol-binding domain-containing protein [Deltaproteobacteria bacterium]|nr:SCP2 sterol-binding domain-containing protein [Deltaproteobacteria bacterium]
MALTAKEIFEEKIPQKLIDNAEKIKTINAVYEFKLAGGDPDVWTLDLTQPGGKICTGSTGQAKCTVSIAIADLSDIVEKKLNPQMAFMSGKLKVVGDMGLALKLGNVL